MTEFCSHWLGVTGLAIADHSEQNPVHTMLIEVHALPGAHTHSLSQPDHLELVG